MSHEHPYTYYGFRSPLVFGIERAKEQAVADREDRLRREGFEEVSEEQQKMNRATDF